MANGEILIGTTVDSTQARILSHGTKIFNDGFEIGEKTATERIIKLLESKAPNCNEEQYNFLGCDCSISYHQLIALIKGENK